MEFLKLTKQIVVKIKRDVLKKHELGLLGSPFKQDLLDLDSANNYIAQLINKPEGLMVARYGSVELTAISNYLGIQNGRHIWSYLNSKQDAWWWEAENIKNMAYLAGFFQPNAQNLNKFCELMIEDSKCIDFLGSWLQKEILFSELLLQIPKTRLTYLEPFFSKAPWTAALKGKKVLVVHPFAKSIYYQYENRELLFANKDILPEFASLKVIPAVQTQGIGDERFKDWFEALEWMKNKIDNSDYDVCLIGCGAYGFPLAAHIKRQGKKAIHLGGVLQLLFGIRGKRWENPNYGNASFPSGAYLNLPNEYWIRPSEEETPKFASNVEGGCYW